MGGGRWEVRELHLLRLSGDQLNGESFSCTGSQFRQLATALDLLIPDWVWYAADVDSIRNAPDVFASGPELVRIGSTAKLIALTQPVEQFYSGVFLALPPLSEPLDPALTMYTESAPGTDYISGSIVVRAFDTSYFEVESSYLPALEALAMRFGGQSSGKTRLRPSYHRSRP